MEQKQQSRLVKYMFQFLQSFEKQLENKNSLKFLINLLHLIIVITFVLNDQLFSYKKIKQQLSIYSDLFNLIIGNHLNSKTFFFVLSIIKLVTILLSLFFFVVSYYEYSSKNNSQKKGTILSIISFLVLISQCLIFLTALEIFKSIQMIINQQMLGYFMLLANIIFIFFIPLLDSIRLCQYFLFLIPLAYKFTSFSQQIILIIAILCYIKKTERLKVILDFIKNIFYGIIIWCCIWATLNKIDCGWKICQKNQLIGIVLLTVGIISIGFIFYLKKVSITDTKSQNQRIWSIIKRIDDQLIDINGLSNQQTIFIQNYFLDTQDTIQKQKINQNFAISHCLPNQLSKAQLLEKVINKFYYQSLRSNMIEDKLILIHSKMILTRQKAKMTSFKSEFLQMLKQLCKLSQNSKFYSIKQQYLIFKFQKFVSNKYLNSNKNSNLNESISLSIITAAGFYQQYLKLIYQIIKLLSSFWLSLKNNKLNENYLNSVIINILQKNQKLYQMIIKMRIYHIHERQQRVFQMIQKSISRIYQHKINQQTQKKKNNKKQLANSPHSGFISSVNYFITNNNSLQKISYKLLCELKINTNDNVIFKHQIFPDCFMYFLQKCQEKATIQSLVNGQKQKLFLPLIDKDNFLVVKKCNIYVLPQFGQGIKFLYHFQDFNNKATTCYLLYQLQTGMVIRASSNFTKQFKIKYSQFDKQFIKSSLTEKKGNGNLVHFLFQQYIQGIDFKSQQCLKNLKSKQGFSCIFNKSKIKKNDKKKVSVKLLETYNLKIDKFYLIQIKKDQKALNSNKNIGSKGQNILKSNYAIQDKVKEDGQLKNQKYQNLQKTYKDQQFFCPIKNPYKNKIQQKQKLLTQPNRFNYISFLLIATIILISTYIIQIFFNQSVQMNSSTNFEGFIEQNKVRDNFYQNTLNCYIGSFSLYNLVTIQNNFNNSTFDYYKSSLMDNIKQYKQNYLVILKFKDNIQSKNNTTNIQFQSFDINLENQLQIFMDYAINFKRCQSGKDYICIQFLIKNFETMINIQQKLVQSKQFIYNKQYQKQISSKRIRYFFAQVNTILMFACFILHTCYLIYSLKIIKKIQIIIQKIVNIFKLINQNQLIENIKKIEEYYSNIPQLDFIKKNNTKQILNSQQQITLQQLETFNSSKQCLKTVQNKPLIQNSSVNQQQKKKTTIFESKYILFLIIFFIMIGLILYQLIYITKAYQNYQNIINYHMYLAQKLNTPFRKYLQMYQKSFEKKTLNNFQLNLTQKVSNKNPRQQPQLPQQFTIFLINQNDILKGNLCQIKKQKWNPIYQKVQCKKVWGGILQKGYSQAFQLYEKYIEILANQNIQNYIDGQNMTLFIQTQYVSEILFFNTKKIKNNFYQTVQIFISNQQINIKFRLIISCIVLLLMTMGTISSFYTLKKRGKIGLYYFFIIPRNNLYKMKITSYLRSQNILQELQMI